MKSGEGVVVCGTVGKAALAAEMKRSSLYPGSLRIEEKVWTGAPRMMRHVTARMEVESTPPESPVPRGTSLRSRMRTES